MSNITLAPAVALPTLPVVDYFNFSFSLWYATAFLSLPLDTADACRTPQEWVSGGFPVTGAALSIWNEAHNEHASRARLRILWPEENGTDVVTALTEGVAVSDVKLAKLRALVEEVKSTKAELAQFKQLNATQSARIATLRNEQISADDERLTDFWERAHSVADDHGYCEVFDTIVTELGGPQREVELSVEVTMTFTVPITIGRNDISRTEIHEYQTNFEITYFTTNYQNAAFSIYATVALFFVVSMFSTLSSRPQLLITSYKKIIASFFIGVLIFIVSSNKSNDLLIFTFAPLAIMATSHIEMPQLRLNQELVLYVLIACSMFAFFTQL